MPGPDPRDVNWSSCPGPEVCFALIHAPESQKDALIVYQARQIERLSMQAHGLHYIAPDPDDLLDDDEDDWEPEPQHQPPALLALTESLLAAEDIFRKPPRVAGPRLLERLAAAGWHMTYEETP